MPRMNICFSTFAFAEAHRALELLEDYHARLSEPQDRALRIAIERVIRIFKSRLFQALLGKYIYIDIHMYIFKDIDLKFDSVEQVLTK